MNEDAVQIGSPDAAAWQRYRLIADNSSDVVYQTAKDGRIAWIQPTVTALLGWKPEDVRGIPARTLVHPDDLDNVNRLRVTVYDGAELDDVPCRFRTASGGYRTCMVRARPLRDESGEVVGAVMTLKDAHEQAAILRALTTLSQGTAVLVRAKEERALLQHMCDTIIEAGKYRFAWYGRRLDDVGKSIVPVAQAGGDWGPLRDADISWGGSSDGLGPSGRALRTGTTEVVADIENEPSGVPWRAPFIRYGTRSSVALPVRVQDEIDGVLVVYAEEPEAFDGLAVGLMEDLAADLGFGLARLRDVDALDQSRHEAEVQREQMRATLDSQLDPFVLFTALRDGDGHLYDLQFVEANQAALDANLATRDELLGRTFLEQYPGLMEHGPMAQYLNCVETGEPVILDDYFYPNEVLGERQRYDIRAVRTGDGMALTWRDVTPRYRAMQAISASERRYRVLAENASDVVWEIDDEGNFVWVSESVTRVLGWIPDQLLGRSSLDIIHADERARAAANRDRVLTGEVVEDEFRMLRPDGSTRWMALRAHAVTMNGEVTRIAALRDIQDEVLQRDELARVLRHDPLTGLANRGVVLQRITRQLEETQEVGGAACVLCIDVDGLGRINEALTNEAGNAVLISIAESIVDEVGDPDLVGRGTGDEFLVTIAEVDGSAEVADLAERIRAAGRRTIAYRHHEVTPSLSVGVALVAEVRDPEEVLQVAALAVRRARADGGDRVAFVDPRMAEEAGREIALESAIRSGLRNGEFVPWLQPIVALETHEVVGYEALVRWIRPGLPPVSPDEFLPLAARTGLITQIDDAVKEASIRLLAELPEELFIAVNVASASLARRAHSKWVIGLLERENVDPRRLHLEVTETTLLGDMEPVRAEMEALAGAGVQWYVDDFGTGYSSISHLRDLPIAGLKLDMSFTLAMAAGDPKAAQLSQALAGLAADLKLDTVAEGVETDDAESLASTMGWRHGQGWLYGRPQPPETWMRH